MYTGSFRAGLHMANGIAVFDRGEHRILVKDRWLEIRRYHGIGAHDHLLLLVDRADAIALANMILTQMDPRS